MESHVLLVNNVEMTLERIELSIMKCEDVEILRKMVIELLNASVKLCGEGGEFESPVMDEYLYRRALEGLLRRGALKKRLTDEA